MTKARNPQQQMSNVVIKQEEEEDVKNIQLLHRINTTAGNSNKITKPKPPKNKNSQEIKIEQDIDIKIKLEAPENDPIHEPPARSQEQINQFIDYVFNQNLSVTKASRKLKMASDKAFYYYHLYMNDPEKKIPLLIAPASTRVNTQEEINTLIRLIVDENVSIMKAAVKANMTRHTARYYHGKYLADPNRNIPSPYTPLQCPQEKVDEVLGYLFDEKMTIKAASEKANMSTTTASKYFRKYLKENNMHAPESIRATIPPDQVQKLIAYIVDEKMTIKAASAKANVSTTTASKYFQKYLKENNMHAPEPIRATIPSDQVQKLIAYIVDEKMTIKAASAKANVSTTTASKYLRKYLKENNMHAPETIRATIPPDQVQKLIAYIVDEKMTIKAASAKANMCSGTGEKYYKQYMIKNNIMPRLNGNTYSQDQVDSLISLIVDDKMTIKDASEKVKMGYTTGKKYYHKYVKDQQQSRPSGCDRGASNDEMDPIKTNEQPCHQIIVAPTTNYLQCTQDQINELISCVVDQKLSLSVASQKANMSKTTARKYYRLYLDAQKHDIPASTTQSYSYDKVKQLYGYIFDDKMSIKAAAVKAGMSSTTARKYYNNFINDHDLTDPPHIIRVRPHPQEKIQELTHYLVDEKMSLVAASRKAKISVKSSRKHYRRYLKAQKSAASRTPNDSRTFRPCTQKTINQLIGYIVDDKMSIAAASKLANVSYSTGKSYYGDFMADPKHAIPTARHLTSQSATPEKLDALIGYIIDDKMTIIAASRKANISYGSGKRHYCKYKRQLSGTKTSNLVVQYTKDQVDALIHNIINDEITIKAAALKANMGYSTALKYYKQYRKDNSS
jgi:response regulator of citrate/malate metabolism